MLFCVLSLAGQTKQTMAVANVKINPALEKRAQATGKSAALKDIAEAMTGLLASDFASSNKFQMVSNSDIDTLIAEQNLSESGNVNLADKSRAKVGEFKGAKYVLAVSINDFQDIVKVSSFKELEKTIEYREIRLGVIGNIIDTSTREILSSAKFTIVKEGSTDTDFNVAQSSKPSDVLIPELAATASATLSDALIDGLFPAKVLAKNAGGVFLNRGTGSNIKEGDVFQIMALDKDLIDPDTGENLGKAEISIGSVRVEAVYPKYSRAQILEDRGIDAGQIARIQNAQ